MRGRPLVTFHEYDETVTPPRLVRAIQRSEWTAEDRALMLAWQEIKALTCRCGEPADRAHHPDNDGEYDVREVTCHACTALARHSDPAAKPVSYPYVVDIRDYEARPLPSLAEWEEWQHAVAAADGPARPNATAETRGEATLG